MMRRRLTVAVLLGALFAPLLSAVGAAPVAAVGLNPGSVTGVRWVSGGAALVLIGSCGNATSSGVPLPAGEASNPDHCMNIDDLQIAETYDTASGLVAVVPATPFDDLLIYEWTEPIGASESTCVHGAEYACRIEVTLLAADFSVLSTDVIDVWPLTPDVEMTGPFDAVYHGSQFDFEVLGLGAGGVAGIAACGNASLDGVPLAAEFESSRASRCEFVLNGDLLDPGPGNHVVGAAAAIFRETDEASGTYEWVDPIATGFGQPPAITCVDGGNFDCVIFFGGSYEDGVAFPVTPGPLPTVAAGTVTVDENAGTASIPLTLDFPIPAEVAVDWATADWTAFAGDDYVAATGTATFAPNSTATTIDIALVDDTTDEFDHTFGVQLTGPTNAEIGGFYGLGFATIVDDDDPPQVIPEFSEWGEGGSIAVLVFRLSGPSEKDVRFDFETVDVSAVDGVDYYGLAGQVLLAPGETSDARFIAILDDELEEPDELFGVRTFGHENSVPGGFYGAAFITILDNDQDCTPLLGPGADLRSCDFSGQTIAGVDLSGADLVGATFDDAVLIDVDLTGADMWDPLFGETSFRRTQFVNVDLTDAFARGAVFADAVFSNSILDGINARSSSGHRAVVINSSLEFADFSFSSLTGITIVGGSMYGAVLEGAIVNDGTLLPDDFGGVSLISTYWGPDTVCPDGTASGAHGDTCWRVPVGYGPIDEPPGTVTLQADLFQATVFPSFQADPADMSLQSWFGPTDFQSLGSAVFDVNGDGFDDRAYAFRTDDSPLLIGTLEYCLDLLVGPDAVYGCADLTVTNDPPPISPPASPPSSPPASGPISGVGGALAGLVPLLSGPVGLALTASGVGFIFLLGSNRASTSLERETREDDDDEPSS